MASKLLMKMEWFLRFIDPITKKSLGCLKGLLCVEL